MAGKGSNSVQVRHYNERVVLESIRRLKDASKADIARYANLTPAAIATIVDGLEASGFVKQIGKRFGQRGQPSIMYRLVPESAYSIGIRIGRRALDAVLLDFAGDIRAQESHEYRFPEPADVKRFGDHAVASFKTFLGAAAQSRIVGVGIASPYFFGGWGEELGFPEALSSRWENVDLTTLFSIAAATPVYIENDGSAAGLAELVSGNGSRFEDFMHVSIDTLIGGGLVQKGQLQTGPNGNTAALGPFPVSRSDLFSAKPSTSPFDILLHRASVYVLVNHLRANGIDIFRVRELDPLPVAARTPLLEWQTDCADALAQAIVGIVAVVDIDAVIIDSILPRAILQDIVAKVQQRLGEIIPVGLLGPEIIAGSLGHLGSAIGAAMLPIYALFAPDSSVLLKKDQPRKPLLIGNRTDLIQT
ncbi:ROK family transcriptional regulator [Phyllobacterium endophyticum]|jgi:predicted NBD/HSP70 family sugar kinase|uniref:ROK family transcriptional regulator n=1 Tax=Phyllobacterium endophyticum TaxID=1149773 RepID=A0A2P7AZB5_9HYPH|nr:ROK family transcriptional regulator [Phyllobacterium endophyticum]MBB3235861.1 putative NBD/HSP70 family sugar kinase [Phyllobacterium endophyticum]PSH59548.1 ROK family transcriptional regulator [Phyllobacterium endophyticum]TXR50189.1 ROK family protein [Phyllobacterium endophyticum]TYR41686.1 ROK family protein [Phyllobacterium endophyticum]